MTRLFLPSEKLAGEKIIIAGEEARYLSLVLRLKPGEQITVFDGSGYRYICNVLQVHKKEVVVEKIKKEPYSAESPVSITLAQGLPKSDKMDLIVRKSTELGVNKIIPLVTERSQIRHTDKVERWRKIALSASQQCGREKIPEIEEVMGIEEFLSGIHEVGARHAVPLQIIFSEEQTERNLKKILTGFKGARHLILLIGPEGGFTRKETDLAVEKGFLEASLGPRVLRTETAPLTAMSIIQYELGDIG